LTIPTQLVQKHAKDILSGNGKAITNFNILEKTSLGYHFLIPHLDTFKIAGSQTDGPKNLFQIFRDLQIVPKVSRYTICPLECPVMNPTVCRSFQYLASSWLYFHDVVHFHGYTCCNHYVLSPAYCFPVPYLDTFSITGSRIGGLRIVFPMFCY
jgi:hypothetical protein